GVDAGRFHIAIAERAAAPREADDRNVRRLSLDAIHECLSGRDAPARELVLGQTAGPAIEDLQRSRASLDLTQQIAALGFNQEIDQPSKLLRPPIRPEACFH